MDNTIYYESFDWQKITEERLKPFMVMLEGYIPEDVHTILDVGCGNGILTNQLVKTYDVTGLDRSASALSYVRAKKILASSDAIPVPDHSFDLVMAIEMIEHLDDATYAKTLRELSRISRKYILITTPNIEDIDKNLIRCPYCGTIFNYAYHQRTISRQSLATFFPDCTILVSQEFGVHVRPYRSWLSRIKRRTTPANSWIPFFWKPPAERNSMCPGCEKPFSYPYRFNPLALSCDLFNILLSPKKPYYMFLLFGKKESMH